MEDVTNGVYTVVITVTKYKDECLKYLHDRKLRGSSNQAKITVHELANNTSVPSWTEAKKMINKFYMEGYNEQSKDETPEGTETETKKESNSPVQVGETETGKAPKGTSS